MSLKGGQTRGGYTYGGGYTYPQFSISVRDRPRVGSIHQISACTNYRHPPELHGLCEISYNN